MFHSVCFQLKASYVFVLDGAFAILAYVCTLFGGGDAAAATITAATAVATCCGGSDFGGEDGDRGQETFCHCLHLGNFGCDGGRRSICCNFGYQCEHGIGIEGRFQLKDVSLLLSRIIPQRRSILHSYGVVYVGSCGYGSSKRSIGTTLVENIAALIIFVPV